MKKFQKIGYLNYANRRVTYFFTEKNNTDHSNNNTEYNNNNNTDHNNNTNRNIVS